MPHEVDRHDTNKHNASKHLAVIFGDTTTESTRTIGHIPFQLDPKVVSTWGELNSIEHRIPDNRLDGDAYGIFQMVFENGVVATSVPAGNWEFEVFGEQGSVRVLNNGESVLLRKSTLKNSRSFCEVAVAQEPIHSTTQLCLEDLVHSLEEERRISLPTENRSLYIFH